VRAALLFLGFALAACGGVEERDRVVALRLESEVAVSLRDVPIDARDRVVGELLAQPKSFWIDRAHRQLAHVRGEWLPPEAEWRVTLNAGAARRAQIDDVEVVTIGYAFDATAASAAQDAHDLVLPIDPDDRAEDCEPAPRWGGCVVTSMSVVPLERP
jgi:hypothetical protein